MIMFLGGIFAYCVAATLFPADKVIGETYPFFGAQLILGSAAGAVAIVFACYVRHRGKRGPNAQSGHID